MYHKMPLLKSYKKKKLLKKRHNKQEALSPKRQKKNMLREASYDTYPDVGRDIRPKASITLEMVVVLPLFISFMVFFLFMFRILLVQESMEEALVYSSRTLAVTCFSESAEKRKTQPHRKQQPK